MLGCVEPILEAVLANDPSRITAAAAAQRMDEDLLVTELPHQLYRGDTPLHLAAAGLRYDAAPRRRRHPVRRRPQRHPRGRPHPEPGAARGAGRRVTLRTCPRPWA